MIIQRITPNYPINRQIWRWALGQTTWEDVEHVIAQQVDRGWINDSIDPAIVKTVATKVYGL